MRLWALAGDGSRQEVEIEEAEASEKHGLLMIKLPKLDKGRQAKLKVKSN